jgi:hypothetical protein
MHQENCYEDFYKTRAGMIDVALGKSSADTAIQNEGIFPNNPKKINDCLKEESEEK